MSRETFIPNEIVEMVLRNLRGKDMFRCRRVCKQWLSVVDRLTAADNWWEDLLRSDYRDIYKEALWKSGLSHRSLYKSFCLWSKIATAKITCTEFLTRRYLNDFQVLPNKVIGVPSFKKDGDLEDLRFEGFDRIKYYNLETGKYKTRIIGETFGSYAENDHLIVVVDDDTLGPQYMTVIPKADKTNTSQQIKLSLAFLLLDKSVYYLDTFREIVCLSLVNKDDGTLEWQLRTFDTYYNIMPESFSYTDGFVNYLTEGGCIYISNGDDFAPIYSVKDKGYNDILHQMRCYNFIPNSSNNESSWTLIYEARLPRKITRMKIQTIVSHGDVVFLTVSGLLYIYYSPISSGPLELNKAKPDRICDLSELCGTTVGTITYLAVIEVEDGHMLVVTTTNQKILLLNISHITEDFEKKRGEKRKLKQINPSQTNTSTSQCIKRVTRSSTASSKTAKRQNIKKKSTRPKRKTTSKGKKAV